jgi:cation diffusion facilitator CzcD-associated flavoprotein CzcO
LYYGKPKIPEQFLAFDGPRIHTANWPKEFDFRGKTVAVIGTGASGLQIIPEMAKVAEHVIVFQR